MGRLPDHCRHEIKTIMIMMITGLIIAVIPIIVGDGVAEGAEISNTGAGAMVGEAKVVHLIEAQTHDEGVDAVVVVGGQVIEMMMTATTIDAAVVQGALHHFKDEAVVIHLITAPKGDGSTVGLINGVMTRHIARSDLHSEIRLQTSLVEKLDLHT
jgi:hypothetical protein